MNKVRSNDGALALSKATEDRRAFVEGQYEHLWKGSRKSSTRHS